MASVFKHGDVWRVQVKVGKVRQSATFSAEEDARGWGRAIEEKLRNRQQAEKLLELGVRPKLFPIRVFQAMLTVPVSAAEIIESSIPKSSFCGIYFLIKDEQIVYVGQSRNAMRRITRHIDEGKEFDRFAMVACEEQDLDRLERTYITAIVPEGNMTFGNPMK
jgi:hypothetical protein